MPADDDALGAPREEGPGADEAVRPASEVDADARALASVVRMRILRLCLDEALTNKQIAERLVISHRTVQNHVQNTLGKLQLHNRVELVRYAIERGLDDE